MAPVNRTLTLTALMIVLPRVVVCQSLSHVSDCSTLKYLRHKDSCLCGTVQVCSGDICGRPSDYKLDDDIAIELRDKSGMTLDTHKVMVETSEKQATTQDGTKTSCTRFANGVCALNAHFTSRSTGNCVRSSRSKGPENDAGGFTSPYPYES